MKNKQIITIMITLVSQLAFGQEQLWQKCNETLPGEISIIPVRCSDNNHQEGINGSIKVTLDNNKSTIWHTTYYPEHKKVTPETPAELMYEFEDVERIDRMVYIPRQDGSTNGCITEAEILVKNTSDTVFHIEGHYTWSCDNNPKTVCFEGGLQKPKAIMLRILHGKNDYGSCAEMRFRCDGGNLTQCPLFADELCTTLKTDVTDEDIEQTKSPIFQELAKQLRNGSYQTAYRVASFDCYDNPLWLSKEWQIPEYDPFQGVTGIVMEQGRHLIILSGLPNGQTVEMKVVAWYAGKTGNHFDGSKPEILTYPLKNGLNIINHDSSWSGLAYINYFSDGHTADNPPIHVHFVGGTVNGYLTPEMTDDEMHQMTRTAPSRFIDVVSQKVHAVWTAAGMYEFCKAEDGKSLGYRKYMEILDSLMTWQQQFVGMEKYGRIPRNRSLLYVNYTYGALYQEKLGISAHIDLEQSLLNCHSLLYGNSETIWGLAHEWGHQHQLRPYFCWGGVSEVTNNLNAYYTLKRIGYQYDDLEDGKRTGLESAVKKYIDGETEDCIFQQNAAHDNAFERLCPFLKLVNYFSTEGEMPDFLPDLYETLRHSNVTPDSTNIVPYVLNFIRKVSELSGYNLTPYFVRFGFLHVKSFELEDYGKFTYNLTQKQLDSFHQEMNLLVKKKKLKAMPDGMVEHIAKLKL